ncbi:hypothetical protein [Hahella ganghwensis]|uniref:hypothetical protein n=1 Tax=Hahella ganghwensis TaxID=286420 RepID=UPI00036C3C1A|nr:hypothetical protein [Hahella ganghwensis]
MDRKFVFTGLIYALIGLLLGIVMAATKNHGQMVTHAHIMLLGFVVSMIYGIFHKLWLPPAKSLLSNIQFFVHQGGTLLLLTGLFLLYGGYADPKFIGPLLGIFSVVVFFGMLLMAVMFWRANHQVT